MVTVGAAGMMQTGSTASVPTKVLAGLIDAFLKRFVEEAARHIPDLTGWGELQVLEEYLPK